MRVSEFVDFIRLRERHRQNKEEGHKFKPDPIISRYRFCNVRRNDDRVTRWIHENMLRPMAANPEVWFAIIVARLFNNEPMLEILMEENCILPFDPRKMRVAAHDRAKGGDKVFNAAYIVSTNGRAVNKIDYVVNCVLEPIWRLRGNLRLSLTGATLDEAHTVLKSCSGLGSFMAAQVVADIKYIPPWSEAPDFHTFAASGPGSKRGLNRILGRELKASLAENTFREKLGDLRMATNCKLKWPEPLTAQDVQNCLCEFDKYERARLSEGRPKQYYIPLEEKE